MALKKLPPPKGADAAVQAARDAVLGSRFNRAEEQPAATAEPARNPEPVAAAPAPAPKPAPASTSREPDGMTRRTYYVSTAAADALDAAVKKVKDATGGRVPKHEILAALISAGAGQVDAVGAQLRADLLRNLSGE